MKNGLVSIVMPAFNSESTIAQSIDSVLGQSYKNWELIIIDDSSLDATIDIVDRYVQVDQRITIVELEKNSGPAVARNKGINLSEGEFIAFLDSDDIWFSNKLDVQVESFRRNRVSLVYSSYNLMDKSGKHVGVYMIPDLSSTYQSLLKGCVIGNLTAIYSVRELGKVFMEDVGHEDYTLWLKILKSGARAAGILEPLASYRLDSTSVSANKFRSAYWQWKIYRKVEGIGFFASVFYFLNYASFGLKKHK